MALKNSHEMTVIVNRAEEKNRRGKEKEKKIERNNDGFVCKKMWFQ